MCKKITTAKFSYMQLLFLQTIILSNYDKEWYLGKGYTRQGKKEIKDLFKQLGLIFTGKNVYIKRNDD